MSEETNEFREIILSLLSKQIEYVLHNYPIQIQSVLEFFKRLRAFLLRMDSHKPGYDESKSLFSFIWETYAGLNK
jgi:hypothetical protein